MAYGRRRRRYGRRSFRRTSYGHRKIARISRRVVHRAIARVTELKRANVQSSLSPTDVAPQLFTVPYLQLGDAVNQRTGRKVLLKRVFMRCRLDQNAAANVVSYMRVLIHKATTGETPDVINHETFGFTDSPLTLTEFRTDYSKGKILHDKVYAVSPIGTPGESKYFELTFNLNDTIHYDGVGGTDYVKNQLSMITISNQSTYVPTIHVETMFTFTDS